MLNAVQDVQMGILTGILLQTFPARTQNPSIGVRQHISALLSQHSISYLLPYIRNLTTNIVQNTVPGMLLSGIQIEQAMRAVSATVDARLDLVSTIRTVDAILGGLADANEHAPPNLVAYFTTLRDGAAEMYRRAFPSSEPPPIPPAPPANTTVIIGSVLRQSVMTRPQPTPGPAGKAAAHPDTEPQPSLPILSAGLEAVEAGLANSAVDKQAGPASSINRLRKLGRHFPTGVASLDTRFSIASTTVATREHRFLDAAGHLRRLSRFDYVVDDTVRKTARQKSAALAFIGPVQKGRRFLAEMDPADDDGLVDRLLSVGSSGAALAAPTTTEWLCEQLPELVSAPSDLPGYSIITAAIVRHTVVALSRTYLSASLDQTLTELGVNPADGRSLALLAAALRVEPVGKIDMANNIVVFGDGLDATVNPNSRARHPAGTTGDKLGVDNGPARLHRRLDNIVRMVEHERV